MDDPLDTGFPCGVEESEGVPHGIGVRELAVVEANPVGVVEDRDALQVLGQESGLIKIEMVWLDAISERIRSGHRIGQGDHIPVLVEETLGDVLAAVTVSTGYGMSL